MSEFDQPEEEGHGAAKLYEFRALLSYHLVVAAESEAEARAEVSRWGTLWAREAEFQDVDVDLFNVREPKADVPLQEQANIVIAKAEPQPEEKP